MRAHFPRLASGGKWARPELHRLLDRLRKGDVVVVSPSKESRAAAHRCWERVNSRPDREPAVVSGNWNRKP